MPKYFPGVTHSIVRTSSSVDDMQNSGVIAYVKLCFVDDSDSLLPITIKKMEGPTSGVTAHIPLTNVWMKGAARPMPVMSGKVADEAKLLALMAFDKMKQQVGVKFNKTYKVYDKNVEEMPNAKRSADVGQRAAV